jgi:methyl-accepting chemotaxis protein
MNATSNSFLWVKWASFTLFVKILSKIHHIEEIAAVSGEQAQGIEQVNKAVAGMDKMVQLNAASAGENASASEELSAQSEQMRTYVNELVVVGLGKREEASGIPQKLAVKDKKAPAMPKRASMTGKVSPAQLILLDEPEFSTF